MSEMFCDTLSEERVEGYWKVLATHLTLDEWAFACWEAIRLETFHKLPLPGKLLAYALEYRTSAYEQRAREERMQREERLLTEANQRQALLSDPERRAEEERCFQEAKESLNKLFGSNWRTQADMQLAMERAARDQRLRKLVRGEDA